MYWIIISIMLCLLSFLNDIIDLKIYCGLCTSVSYKFPNFRSTFTFICLISLHVQGTDLILTLFYGYDDGFFLRKCHAYSRMAYQTESECL
jgi:hypothetical protein